MIARRSRTPALVLSMLIAGQASGQSARPDSARVIGATVITAERVRTPIALSTGAVTRIERAQLLRTPHASFGDLLRQAPGFTVSDTDGLGGDPQVMVRGFYGGGEAEYVVVLVDGRPVAQVQTGLIPWEALPPVAAIEAIEIVRGGASSVYGDAAIGGVINVITVDAVRNAARIGGRGHSIELAAGALGSARLALASTLRSSRGGLFSHALGLDRMTGFRDHASRTSARGQGSWSRVGARGGEFGVGVRWHSRDFDEPGPLLESLAAVDRTRSDTLFRFDRTRDTDVALSVDAARPVRGGGRFTARLLGELRDVNAIRTLALAPGFGDTKERVARNDRLFAVLQAEWPALGRADARLAIGLEAGHGSVRSQYFDRASGTRDDYGAASDTRGARSTDGRGSRLTTALYAQYAVDLTRRVGLSLGGRLDQLDDRYRLRFPTASTSAPRTHAAFSPKAALRFTYASTASSTGSVYASANRSFKAPTLDQLFDQRMIPVPFPPFAISTSNPDLVAQHGWTWETGLNHQQVVGEARASYSLAVYQMDMRDELDFDVMNFRYVNLGRSRHRGVEAGARLDRTRVSLNGAWTLQEAVNQQGANEGNRLKAIPRTTLAMGATVRPLADPAVLSLGLLANHARDAFLDDANTRRLPEWTRFDAQVTYRVLGTEISLEARNLFDRRNIQGGFPDPGGTGEAYLHPAAGRVVTLGARRAF